MTYSVFGGTLNLAKLNWTQLNSTQLKRKASLFTFSYRTQMYEYDHNPW